MLEQFPRIELGSREDLEHVFRSIREHALAVVQEELKNARQLDRQSMKACQQTIDRWIESSIKRVEPNVSVNGLDYKEGISGVEPFDQALSQRVQHLSEKADKLTADAITARKTIPRRKADIMQQRSAALAHIDKTNEKRRREVEEEFLEPSQHITPEPLSLQREPQIVDTIHSASQQIEDLTVSLLEHTSAAHEQTNFVKRLRIMSASYE